MKNNTNTDTNLRKEFFESYRKNFIGSEKWEESNPHLTALKKRIKRLQKLPVTRWDKKHLEPIRPGQEYQLRVTHCVDGSILLNGLDVPF